MLKLRNIIVLFVIFMMVGCAKSVYSPMMNKGYHKRPVLNKSVFSQDNKVVSNEGIAQILGGRIKLPQKCNIAVIRVGNYYYPHAALEGAYLERITNGFKDSQRIVQVAHVPEILLSGNEFSISQLRGAAARLQCELVLIYSINEDVDFKKRRFHRTKGKISSSVSGMLLHTRTGAVPFSTMKDHVYKTLKNKRSEDHYDFIERTKHEATFLAIDKLSQSIVTFLDQIDKVEKSISIK